MPERDRPTVVPFRPTDEIHAALVAECHAKETNKNVMLNRILAERYDLPYEPSEQSARRTVPTGGGPRRAAA